MNKMAAEKMAVLSKSRDKHGICMAKEKDK
jgi:hypothetical protein